MAALLSAQEPGWDRHEAGLVPFNMGPVTQLEATSSFLPMGAMGISLALQPALGGSHHSSSGRQRPQEKVTPLQALVVTGCQAEGNSDPFQSEELLLEGRAPLSGNA